MVYYILNLSNYIVLERAKNRTKIVKAKYELTVRLHVGDEWFALTLILMSKTCFKD